ncbi:unnamed protein product [Rotaria sp. Silwood1]|nr:unnamed protein product [Rotaria sp. Silwood1]
MLSSSSIINNKQIVSNNITDSLSNKSITTEKINRTFSFNSIRKETNEIDQTSKIQSKSFLIPTENELDNDIVIVKFSTSTSSTPVSLTTAICHFLDKGIPSLTLYEEIRLVNELINHRLNTLLTLTDAQLHVEQYVINIDFKQTLMPINSDKIVLKKWQLATLLHAHMNLEQNFH